MWKPLSQLPRRESALASTAERDSLCPSLGHPPPPAATPLFYQTPLRKAWPRAGSQQIQSSLIRGSLREVAVCSDSTHSAYRGRATQHKLLPQLFTLLHSVVHASQGAHTHTRMMIPSMKRKKIFVFGILGLIWFLSSFPLLGKSITQSVFTHRQTPPVRDPSRWQRGGPPGVVGSPQHSSVFVSLCRS